MELKWFFVLIGIFLAFAILIGMYFIGLFISTQSQAQFERSVVIHEYLFDNITELKQELDPIIDQIPNATESKRLQDLHYNVTQQNFKYTVENNMILKQINQSLYQTTSGNQNNTSGNNTGVKPPIIIVENITDTTDGNSTILPANNNSSLSTDTLLHYNETNQQSNIINQIQNTLQGYVNNEERNDRESHSYQLLQSLNKSFHAFTNDIPFSSVS